MDRTRPSRIHAAGAPLSLSRSVRKCKKPKSLRPVLLSSLVGPKQESTIRQILGYQRTVVHAMGTVKAAMWMLGLRFTFLATRSFSVCGHAESPDGARHRAAGIFGHVLSYS